MGGRDEQCSCGLDLISSQTCVDGHSQSTCNYRSEREALGGVQHIWQCEVGGVLRASWAICRRRWPRLAGTPSIFSLSSSVRQPSRRMAVSHSKDEGKTVMNPGRGLGTYSLRTKLTVSDRKLQSRKHNSFRQSTEEY